MGIFQHKGPVVVAWFYRDGLGCHKTTVFIEYQVEIIPLPGIVADPEIPDKHLICIINLDKCAHRQFGAVHIQNADPANVALHALHPFREIDIVELVGSGQL